MRKWRPGGIKLLAQSCLGSQRPWWDENSVLWTLDSVIVPLLLCYSEPALVMSTWNICVCLRVILLGVFNIQRWPFSRQVFSDIPHLQWTFVTTSLEPIAMSQAQNTVNSWSFSTTKIMNLSTFIFFLASCPSFLLAHKSLPLQLCFNYTETSINWLSSFSSLFSLSQYQA